MDLRDVPSAFKPHSKMLVADEQTDVIIKITKQDATNATYHGWSCRRACWNRWHGRLVGLGSALND